MRMQEWLATAARAPARTRSWLDRLYSHPYNKQHCFSALGRLGRWFWIQHGKQPRDLSFWGSRRIRCYPDAEGSMWLILNEVMDWNEFHFMKAYLRSDDVFFDVGANLGIYTLWASQFIEESGQLVAFEPDATNRERLHEQLALNDLGRVRVEALALADRAGTVRLTQGADMTNHLVMEDDASPQTVDVKAQTLDAFSAEHGIERIHFAKVDVEGVELLVLRGAKKALAEHRIDVLQLEFNEQASARGLGGNALEELLQDNGYSLFRYDAAATMLMPVPTAGEAGEMNLLALHDLAAVGARLEG